MLHPNRLESSRSSHPEKVKILKCGTAVTVSILLCAPIIPACIEKDAYAEDAAIEQITELDADVARAYAIAALYLNDLGSVSDIEAALANSGYTRDQVLILDIAKLQSIDSGLASSIYALQERLIAGDPVEPEITTTPATSTEPDNPDPTAPPSESDDDDSEKPEDDPASKDSPADKDSSNITSSSEKDRKDPDATAESEPLLPLNPANEEMDYPDWSYEGSTEYTRYPVSRNLTTRKFIAVIGEQARELAAENDLYASVMIAQAILESDSGNSGLSQNPNFNLFGIKGSYEDQSVTKYTTEDDGTGSLEVIAAEFRKYPSFRSSLEDYVALLTQEKPRFYSGARKSNAATYGEACKYLQGRYATDTAYAAKLAGIIDAYDLTRYDEELDFELVDPIYVPVETEDTALATAANAASDEPTMEERTLADLADEVTSHLGEDYVWGGTTCGSFDCSGLMCYSYSHAFDMTLPRTTHYQCLKGEDVDFEDLHTGDLVFFTDSDGVCCHVGMYLGEGCYIESPQPGDVVKITTLEEKEPTFAKRLLETKPATQTEKEPATPVEPIAVHERNAIQADPQKIQPVKETADQSVPKRDGQLIWDVDAPAKLATKEILKSNDSSAL